MRSDYSFMKKRIPVFFLAGVIFPVFLGSAAPAVSPETLKGLWESVREKEMRVIRMEIKSDKEAYLLIARHPEGFWTFRLKEMKLEGNRLQMAFISRSENATARFDAAASLSDEGGVLKGTLTLEPDPDKQSVPDLEFLKLPKDFKDEIEPGFKPAKEQAALLGAAKKE